MITITRKVQLSFNVTEADTAKRKELLDEYYGTLFKWQRVVFMCANKIATHCYLQEQMKEMIYLQDDVKVKLTDNKKDPEGILTTSKQNSTYQMISSIVKGEVPMAIISCLNSIIVSTYNKERKEYFTGVRSLRNYKRDIPIPFQYRSMANMRQCDEYGNYAFDLFGLPFKTFFGADHSGNKIIWNQALEGKYKFCDSSIQIKNGKIFLLAVFQFEKSIVDLDTDKVCEAELSMDTPIMLTIDRKKIKIGDKEEFLHRRLAIQAAMRRHQKAARYNKNGKGRSHKLKSIEHFQEKESNYIRTRIHMYTYRMIEYCINNRCGKLVLKKQTEKETEAKEDDMLLRNWSYFDMKQKIQYKAAKVGILVEIE